MARNRGPRHYAASLSPEMLEEMLSPGGVSYKYSDSMVFDLSVEFEDDDALAEVADVLEAVAEDLRAEHRAVTEKEASP